MLYVRGNPADFDGWAQMGCRGWGYDDVLPYFRKSEHYGPGDPAFRGKGGVLRVEDYRTVLLLTHRFVEAAQQAGHAFRRDLNGEEQEGVGYSQMTRSGRFRGSTARTFLAAAKGRPNLRVETGAVATRLLFAGRRCVGAAFHQAGAERELRAAREVVLCGGAVNSPQLLQISGIGPAEHLRASASRWWPTRPASAPTSRTTTSPGCRTGWRARCRSTSWRAAPASPARSCASPCAVAAP
jgi:choline dehydrogenase